MTNFYCSTCKKTFSMPDDYAGKSASCKGCGKSISEPIVQEGNPLKPAIEVSRIASALPAKHGLLERLRSYSAKDRIYIIVAALSVIGVMATLANKMSGNVQEDTKQAVVSPPVKITKESKDENSRAPKNNDEFQDSQDLNPQKRNKPDKNAERLQEIAEMKKQADAFIAAGEHERGLGKYSQILDVIEKEQIHDAAVSSLIARISASKKQATEYIEQQKKHQQEQVTTAALSERPGKATFTITWKYNKVIGNKPDVDALVVLIPVNRKGMLPSGCLEGKNALQLAKNSLEAKGGYFEVAGGDGKARFNKVKAGKYGALIISKNATENTELWERQKELLETIFEQPISNSSLRMHKMTILDVEIASGEMFEKSHDFGYTYFATE